MVTACRGASLRVQLAIDLAAGMAKPLDAGWRADFPPPAAHAQALQGISDAPMNAVVTCHGPRHSALDIVRRITSFARIAHSLSAS